MAGPTAQAHDGEWYDDPEIADNDELLRVVKTPLHVVPLGDGTYGLSPQLWTSQKGGCSVELSSLVAADGGDAPKRVVANGGIGAAGIGVDAVRSTMNRIDERTKQGIEPLGVAYTPILDDQPFGPNPYHSDVFPKLGNPGRNTLHAKARVLLLDQKTAAELHAARHGLKTKT